MASEKTLALRATDQQPRMRILSAGPTASEAQGVITNRRARLGIERKTLTRAQRMELRDLRRERKWLGYEPPLPEWAKPKREMSLEQMAAFVEQSQAEQQGVPLSEDTMTEEQAIQYAHGRGDYSPEELAARGLPPKEGT